MLPSASVVDVISRTGLDFIIIDLEHGNMSMETAENMVRAARMNNCQPVIRVGDDQPNTILRALETNCRAILVPNVNSKKKAQNVVNAARYYPAGMRGLSPYTSCHDYTHENVVESIRMHSDETFVGILVEGLEGLLELEEISRVDGLDLIYLGLYDISQSVGVPGDVNHVKVQNALNDYLAIIKNKGKLAGIFGNDVETCRKFKSMGFDFVAFVADSYAVHSFYSSRVKAFRTNE